MATPTYIPIATTTLVSSSSSVLFAGITQDFRDLVLVCNFTLDNGSTYAYGQLNGDTSTNYSYVYMRGNNTSAETSSGATPFFGLGVGDTTNPILAHIQIMDYSATDKHKIILGRYSMIGDSRTRADVHRWGSTSAVNSITLAGQSGSSFKTGSTFSLYGIANEVA